MKIKIPIIRSFSERKKFFLITGLSFAYLLAMGVVLFFSTNCYFRNYVFIFKADRDWPELLLPLDVLAEKGIYSEDGIHPYAGRIPSLFFPYGVFRFFLDAKSTIFVSGFFQLILKSISVYLLWKIFEYEKVSRTLKFIGVLFYLFLPYYWYYDYEIHPLSIAVSMTVFLAYFMYIVIKLNKEDNWIIFIIGLIVTYLFFLRPFLAVWLLSALIILFLHFIKQSFNKTIKKILVFIVPFLIIDGIWTFRNYVQFNKMFIPVQSTFVPFMWNITDYDYNSRVKNSIVNLRTFIDAFGGQTFWYFPNSEMGWFLGVHSNFEPMQKIITKRISEDSLLYLRNLIIFSLQKNDTLSMKQKDSIENKIIATTNRYIKYFKEDRPFTFYIFSKIRKIKNFLFVNTTQEFYFPCLNTKFFYYFLRICSLMEYFTVITLFSFFTIITFINRKIMDFFSGYLLLSILTQIIVFIFILNTYHYIYFSFSYVLVFLFVFVSIAKIEKQIKLKKVL